MMVHVIGAVQGSREIGRGIALAQLGCYSFLFFLATSILSTLDCDITSLLVFAPKGLRMRPFGKGAEHSLKDLGGNVVEPGMYIMLVGG